MVMSRSVPRREGVGEGWSRWRRDGTEGWGYRRGMVKCVVTGSLKKTSFESRGSAVTVC